MFQTEGITQPRVRCEAYGGEQEVKREKGFEKVGEMICLTEAMGECLMVQTRSICLYHRQRWAVLTYTYIHTHTHADKIKEQCD